MRRLAGLIVAALSAGAACAQEAPPACPSGGMAEGADQVVCLCPAGAASGSVWGSDPYTADSDLCTAAVHAGVRTPNGGAIQAFAVSGSDSFIGSQQNGVTSADWGSYPRAFSFAGAAVARAAMLLPACHVLPADGDSVICTCPAAAEATGPVWGSGPYTADSDICTAARHAGVIGAQGGPVLASPAPGAAAYAGSTANGIATGDWGSFDRSLTVSAAP